MSSHTLWRPADAETALCSGSLLKGVTSEDADARAEGRDAWATVLSTSSVVGLDSTYPLLRDLYVNKTAIQDACVLDYQACDAGACFLSVFPLRSLITYDADAFTSRVLLRLGLGAASFVSGFIESEIALSLSATEYAALRQQFRLMDRSSAEEDETDEGGHADNRGTCVSIIAASVRRSAALAAELVLASPVGAVDGLHWRQLCSIIPAAYMRLMVSHCAATLGCLTLGGPCTRDSSLDATSPSSERLMPVVTQRLLVLGTGAGILPAVLRALPWSRYGCTLEVTCVDSSSTVLSLADEWLRLGQAPGEGGSTVLKHGDAVDFVCSEAVTAPLSGVYAAIVVDLYSQGLWPAHAATEKFIAGLAAIMLKPIDALPDAEDRCPGSPVRLPRPAVLFNLDPRLPCYDRVLAALESVFEEVTVYAAETGLPVAVQGLGCASSAASCVAGSVAVPLLASTDAARDTMSDDSFWVGTDMRLQESVQETNVVAVACKPRSLAAPDCVHTEA